MNSSTNAQDIYAGLGQRLTSSFRRRWWLIPLSVVAFTAFIWAQESDLQRTPGSYGVYQTFELRDPALELMAVGIPANAVASSPSDEALAASFSTRASSVSGSPKVSVTLSSKSVDFTSAMANDSGTADTFSFTFDRTRTITFGCVEESRSLCESALASAVEEFFGLRSDAFLLGISRLERTLGLAIASESTPDSEKSRLLAQRAFLTAMVDVDPLEPVLIATQVEERGATVSSVAGRSYTFGIGVGLLLGVLFVLQAALTDRRIRIPRDITNLLGSDVLLGTFTTDDARTNRELRAAAEVWQAEHPPEQPPVLCVEHSGPRALIDEVHILVGSSANDLVVLDNVDHSALVNLRARLVVLCIFAGESLQPDLVERITLLRRLHVADLRVVLCRP